MSKYFILYRENALCAWKVYNTREELCLTEVADTINYLNKIHFGWEIKLTEVIK